MIREDDKLSSFTTDKENRISLSVAGGRRLFGMARAH
jgi:hypothetical protein